MRRALSTLTSLALGSLLFASFAAAQSVYRWVDEEGEVHYTDDKDSIPAAKKKTAKVTKGVEIGIAPGASSGAPDEQPTAEDEERAARRLAAEAEAQAKQEEEAKEEASWRARFQEARGTVEKLEQALEADRAVLADPNKAGIPIRRDVTGNIVPNRKLERMRARLPQQEQELAAAREALADLERAAARKAVPLHWRR